MRSFVLSLVFFIALSVQAQVLDLYTGAVAVPDQSVAARLQSVPNALIQVLQKHSGQRELPVHPALDAALLTANRIMVSFFYRKHQIIAPDATSTNEWRLVASFQHDAVDRIVQQLGLPRWQADRLPITIWIVVDDGIGRRLMPVEYEYAWNALKDIAHSRGLPLFWPELDDEQMLQVDLQLLWGGFTDELSPALRSNRDVVIVAARREGFEWNVRWNFGSGEQTSSWRSRDTDLSFALVEGLHRLTDFVAARDAIAVSGQSESIFELSVRGFRGADDYARCLAYLEGLDVVDSVEILEAGRGVIRFSLALNARPMYLQDEIERRDVLLPGESSFEYSLAHPLPVVVERGED